MPQRKKVLCVTHIMNHYRVPFHNLVRKILSANNVEYDVLSGLPNSAERKKGDLGDLPFASYKAEISLLGSYGNVVYNPVYCLTAKYDLVIVTQENKYLLNYLLQMSRFFRRGRLAFMGHGKNFQSRNPNSLAERWKRFWATKVDWWFAYTNESRRHLESLGYPTNRITVFNNSVDISEIRSHVLSTSTQRLDELKSSLGIVGENVGVFLGGLYAEKRLDFLIQAADIVRMRLPNFELIIIGGGQERPLVDQLASDRPWIHVVGPKFGRSKVELMLLGHVYMMPGLVGLGVLDAGATRLPVATTNYPWHSPEIAYLTPDKEGIIVDNWQDPVSFGNSVADLLVDVPRRLAMAEQAELMSQKFSIESMANNFASGVLKALHQ